MERRSSVSTRFLPGRRTPFYTPRERAALAWTEAVTLVASGGVPDDIFEVARKRFSEKELVDLTMGIVAINGWNRLNVAFRMVPGDYQPGSPGAQAPTQTDACGRLHLSP